MHRKQKKNGSTEPTILEAYKSFTNRLNPDLGSTQLKARRVNAERVCSHEFLLFSFKINSLTFFNEEKKLNWFITCKHIISAN